nr:MAG TPA: baseplate wedge protein [Caudoviricetes sp.]
MAKVRVYRTINGDTWDLIAYKIYGNEQYFHKLIRANLNLINISIFDSNIPVIIPEFLETEVIENKKLPPWKR